jgi:hypothetical protein
MAGNPRGLISIATEILRALLDQFFRFEVDFNECLWAYTHFTGGELKLAKNVDTSMEID